MKLSYLLILLTMSACSEPLSQTYGTTPAPNSPPTPVPTSTPTPGNSASVPGPMGSQGVQGNTGQTGAQGFKGSTGATGERGLQGPTGANGLNGTAGSGTSGSNGAKGNTGMTGSTGSNGSAGALGTTGRSGATGSTGPQGATGPSCSIHFSKTSFTLTSSCKKINDTIYAYVKGSDILLSRHANCDCSGDRSLELNEDRNFVYISGIMYVRDSVNCSVLDVINFN